MIGDLLFSKYRFFPKHELRSMGLIPPFEDEPELTQLTGSNKK